MSVFWQRLKPIILFVVIFALGFLASGYNTEPAQAQANWFAYLYNGATKSFVRVNLDGTQQTFDLNLPEYAYVSPWDSAFSADGSRLAFCNIDFSSYPGPAQLVVRDIPAQANVLLVNLGTAVGCGLSPQAISADGTQLVVSILHFYPGDPQATSPDGPIWQILVLDASTGAILHELNPQSPALTGLGMTADFPILPHIRYFADNQLIFQEVPYGIGGAPSFRAFLWQLATNTVQPVENWGSTFLDTLSTGELIWLESDPNLPISEAGGDFPSLNALILADKSGAKYLIYHNPDWALANARFINNGQQIAIMLLPPFDPAATVQQTPRWVALDRSGNVTDLQSPGTYSDLVAAPQGYLLLSVDYLGENFTSPQSTLTYYSGGIATVLWQDSAEAWSLVWAMPVPVAEGLPPFPSFNP